MRKLYLASTGNRAWWATLSTQKARAVRHPTKAAWHKSMLKCMVARCARTSTSKAFWYTGVMTKAKAKSLLLQIRRWRSFDSQTTVVSDNCKCQVGALKALQEEGKLKKYLLQPSRSPDLSALDARQFSLLAPLVRGWVAAQNTGATTQTQMKNAISKFLKKTDKSLVGWEKKWPARLRQLVELKGELLP